MGTGHSETLNRISPGPHKAVSTATASHSASNLAMQSR